MKKYYLAYGSNLNLQSMHIRCNDSKFIDTAKIMDYRLVYKGIANYRAYLTIEKAPGFYVPIGIYEISDKDEKLLDYYEGVPIFYYKHRMFVDKIHSHALIYIMNNDYDYYLPTNSYINECKQGYNDMGFEQELLDQALNYTKTKQFTKKLS